MLLGRFDRQHVENSTWRWIVFDSLFSVQSYMMGHKWKVSLYGQSTNSQEIGFLVAKRIDPCYYNHI